MKFGYQSTLRHRGAAAYDLVKQKDFPAVTIGRRILVPVACLKSWLAQQASKKEDIAKLLGVNPGTISHVSRQYCQEGLQATLTPKRQPTQHPPIKIDGVVQAHIEQIACSKPPEGRSGWTLQLIADKLIELRIVDHICPESVRKALKKRTSSAPE